MYKYLYYKLYKLSKSTEKQWSARMRIPEWVALFAISILGFLNIMTVLIVITRVFEFQHINLTPIHGLMAAAIFLLINYFIFIYKGKYISIEEKYDRELDSRKKIKNIFFWVYVVLTISVIYFILPIFIEPKINR